MSALEVERGEQSDCHLIVKKITGWDFHLQPVFDYLDFAFALIVVLRFALGLSANFPLLPFTIVSSTRAFNRNSLSSTSSLEAASRMISMHCFPVRSLLSSNAWATACTSGACLLR